MCRGIALLDEALELARQERAALENANYEEAIELAERRGELTGMAWGLLVREAVDAYRGRLLEQARLQEQLSDIAAQFDGEARHQLLHAVESFDQANGYLSAALELLKGQNKN